jgi:hypothetical protein
VKPGAASWHRGCHINVPYAEPPDLHAVLVHRPRIPAPVITAPLQLVSAAAFDRLRPVEYCCSRQISEARFKQRFEELHAE